MQFCLLIWLLCIAGVNSRRSESEDPSIQFLYSHITVIENETIIEIPVIRSGNLDAFLSISCITEPITAEVGLDFQERMTSKESVILFHPGEQIKNCVVPVVDDDLLEPQEVFLLKLNNVKSSNGIVSSIGPNRVVTVTIVYDEDNPTIQLDRSMYTVSRPTSKNHPATVVVSVLRKGDINQTSTVGISTQDGLAVAGLDYHPKRTVIVFQPGEIEHLFEVEILYIEDYPEWRKSFKVILLFDELVNATLGAMSMATVTILENRSLGSAVFPAAPIVVSLAYYDDVEIGMNLDPSPGYPLICVTSCDAKFPGYSAMAHLCNESGINVSHIRYSWETAQTAITNGTTVAFKKVTAANLFARTDMAVLDSIFFKYGYLVRCAVQPILRNQQFGVPIRSKPVFIDRTNALCHTVALTSDLSTGFQSPSFIATLKYQGFHEKLHPNRLHIHIEVPHQDGMLPLISTSPLHNLQLLLMDPIYRKEHLCSNLILPNETEGILGDGFLKNFDFHLIEPPSAILSSFPYQFDPILRGHEAVLLYRHLNMKKCVWTFDAWYHMTELVDLCGGYILSDAQVQNPAKSYTTVHVPLYVSYVFTSSFAQWTSIEHHTEMEFSFTYNTVLWQTGLEVDRSFSAQFQILRILLGSSGQLIIHFKTKAKFRGMFVLQHPTLLSVHSQLIPPSHIVLTFNLTLLWTAKTYDGPTQRWTAISDYSLKDYTGKYILKLVPCTVSPNQVYVMTKDLSAAQSVCTAHRPESIAPLLCSAVLRRMPFCKF